MVFGFTDTETSVTTTAVGGEVGTTTVGGMATTVIPLKSPEVVAKLADIQQKFPWRIGFLTYHQVPSGLLPTISAVCPGFNSTTTGQPVPGPERQLSGCPLGEATGTDGDGRTAEVEGVAEGATTGAFTEGVRGEAVSVGFTTTALIVGKLQAKINIEIIDKTRIRRFIIVPPFVT
jgi:hypothetical protein